MSYRAFVRFLKAARLFFCKPFVSMTIVRVFSYTAAAPHGAPLPDSSHDRKRATTCSRFRRGGKAGGPAAPVEATGTGLDHRRRGRRSERHRELFAGGRAVRLRHAVDRKSVV